MVLEDGGETVLAATACPICGGASPLFCDKYAHGHTWHVRRCASCGHGFVANGPTLETLAAIYAGDSHLEWDPSTISAAAHERRSDCQSLVADVLSLTGARRRSLDIGCGDGAFSYWLAKAGFAPHMIDLDPRAGEGSKLLPGSVFWLVSLEQFADEASRQSPPQRFDVIVMSQVRVFRHASIDG